VRDFVKEEVGVKVVKGEALAEPDTVPVLHCVGAPEIVRVPECDADIEAQYVDEDEKVEEMVAVSVKVESAKLPV